MRTCLQIQNPLVFLTMLVEQAWYHVYVLHYQGIEPSLTNEKSLAPYLTRTQGLDISASMVEQYNLTSRNQNLYPLEMFAVEGNLLDANNPSPESLKAEEWWEFEIAAVGLGFHHFEDPRFAARQLARRLKKGGVLLVIDFCSHAPIAGHHTHAHEHEHEHGKAAPEKTNTEKFLFGPGESNEETKTIAATVKHHGFSEDEMREIFTDAGVGGSFGYSVIEKDITFKTATKSMVRRVFVCKGTKM